MNLKSVSALAAAAMLGAGIPLGCGAEAGSAAVPIEDLTLIEESESLAVEANADIQPRDRDADRVLVPFPDRIHVPDRILIPDRIFIPDRIHVPDRIFIPDRIRIPVRVGPPVRVRILDSTRVLDYPHPHVLERVITPIGDIGDRAPYHPGEGVLPGPRINLPMPRIELEE